MSSLHSHNWDQIQRLISDYHQEDLNLEKWSQMPQFQWFNPEVLLLSIILYQEGINTRSKLETRGKLVSAIGRYKYLASSILRENGNQTNLIAMVVRYLTLMIQFDSSSSPE